MSQVVPQHFSEFWTPNQRLGKPMIFVFDDLRSMGTCIKLVTTISPNFCGTFEKVGKLRSYVFVSLIVHVGSIFSKCFIPKRR